MNVAVQIRGDAELGAATVFFVMSGINQPFRLFHTVCCDGLIIGTAVCTVSGGLHAFHNCCRFREHIVNAIDESEGKPHDPFF